MIKTMLLMWLVIMTAGVTPAEIPPPETQTYTITAYCPCSKCCGIWTNGITSTGTTATAGRTIAVDPKVIPYGSTVIIDGKEYVAEDCGGAIKGNRIDMYFDTHAEALRFGRQVKEVIVNVKN